MAEYGCSPDMIREHEHRITENRESTQSAHKRIDALVSLVESVQQLTIGFTKLVGNVESMTKDLTTIVKTLDRHEQKIESIEDKMETKDTVMKLYERMDKADIKHTEGMDAIMSKLRQQDEALDEHKQEPARDAYEREKSIKKWLVGAVGAIIASQYLPDIINAIFK